MVGVFIRRPEGEDLFRNRCVDHQKFGCIRFRSSAYTGILNSAVYISLRQQGLSSCDSWTISLSLQTGAIPPIHVYMWRFLSSHALCENAIFVSKGASSTFAYALPRP
jgi:hypothetical protein